MSKFCPECGVKNEDNAVFCVECGTKITFNIEPTPPIFEKPQSTAKIPDTYEDISSIYSNTKEDTPHQTLEAGQQNIADTSNASNQLNSVKPSEQIKSKPKKKAKIDKKRLTIIGAAAIVVIIGVVVGAVSITSSSGSVNYDKFSDNWVEVTDNYNQKTDTQIVTQSNQ